MAPPSPKSMMIDMMEEEREEQQRALDQMRTALKRLSHGRLMPTNSPEYSQKISDTYFRKHHFHQCTIHERITNENGGCLESPLDDTLHNIMKCRQVQADKTEEEAYWAEVEENAMTGGAGSRERSLELKK